MTTAPPRYRETLPSGDLAALVAERRGAGTVDHDVLEEA